MRPHRRQPTRLPRPWDSPGKNTGVGCHFFLQCMKVKSESEVAHSCPILATPWTAAYQTPLSMGFSRQKYWSGVPLPSPFNLLLLLLRHFSRVRLFTTPWTAAYQTPLSMGFSRQEYWSGAPLPSPHCSMQTLICGIWDLVPWPGLEPGFPALGAWSLSHWTTREVPEVSSSNCYMSELTLGI